MRLLVTLAALAIGIAVWVVGQELNTVDPQFRQQIEAVIMKFDDAYYKNDAAAIADLFAPDAVEVWGWDKFSKVASGQQAIERRYRVHFPKPGDLSAKLLQVYAIGNEICTISEFNHVITGGKGYVVRIYVREGDTWKIRVAYVN
jgi:uncharacterized protein (TIGR02246 family)